MTTAAGVATGPMGARLVVMDAASARDVLGVTVTPLVSNSETGDQFGVFHAVVPPGVGIPLHTHPDVELFFLLRGELRLLRPGAGGSEDLMVAAHQGGLIPANAPHGFVNAGAEAAEVLITCTKGLEAFLAEAGRPVTGEAPDSAPDSAPGPEEVERVLAIAGRHGQVFVMAA